jgi:ATP binding cassette subfamily A (ABC1) protein 13
MFGRSDPIYNICGNEFGELGQLMVAFDNETQIFSMDSVNLKEEILDCLVINNMTNKVDFLQLNPISTPNGSQNTKWECIYELIHLGNKMLTENNMDIGTYFKMVVDFTLGVLWGSRKKNYWEVFNPLLILAQHPHNLLRVIERDVEPSSGIISDCGDILSKGLFFNIFGSEYSLS